MPISHQEQEYNELQASRPCVGRGEIELQIIDKPATSCCKAKKLVESSYFFCTILNRKIIKSNFCWTCTNRKV